MDQYTLNSTITQLSSNKLDNLNLNDKTAALLAIKSVEEGVEHSLYKTQHTFVSN